MNLEELWVGERLTIKSSGEYGTFEGMEKGQVRIRIRGEVKLFDLDNVEQRYHKPKAKEIKVSAKESSVPSPLEKANFKNEIDLHLSPTEMKDFRGATDRIRMYQLRRAEKFIKRAIKLGAESVIIIHGKGEGVLKDEVYNLLAEYKEAAFKNTSHNGGAVEVIFSY